MGMLGSKKWKEIRPPEGPKVVSLREGIKKLVAEIQEESLARMKQELLDAISKALEAQKQELGQKLESHFEEFDEHNILEEIREIKEKLLEMQKNPANVSDEGFRANLIKSVDETVREKLQELEQAKSMLSMPPAGANANMKEISSMIIKQFESLRDANQQELNALRGQLSLLKQKLGQLEELEGRLHELENLIQRKLAEPVIIE